MSGDRIMTPVAENKVPVRRPTCAVPKPVKRFLDYLFVECGLAGNTVVAYRTDLCAFWGDVAKDGVWPADLDISGVQQHLVGLRERGLSTTSIARHLACIKMFLRYAHQYGLLRRDVASLIELPKKWQRLPETIHYQQIEDLLAAPNRADEFYSRDKALLELLYATGMRVSELTGLTLDRVNLDVGYLRCNGKGNKERILPIGRTAIRAVQDYLRKLRPAIAVPAAGKALFVSRTGRPLDRTSVWRLVRKYALRAGRHASLEIEVTPEMVQAGAMILFARLPDVGFVVGDDERLVCDIFQAMADCSSVMIKIP